MYYASALLEELWALARAWARRQPRLVRLAAVVLCMVLVRVGVHVLGGPTGHPTTTLTGRVVLEGTPLADGTIQFLPAGNGQPSSGRVTNGFFRASKVPLGPCRVICIATRETGKILSEGGHSFPEHINLIPLPYRNGVDVVVDVGTNDLRFDWKSPGK